jgi:hypothetical protein
MNLSESAKALASVERKRLSKNQNQIHAGGIEKRFDVFHYRQFHRFGQSIECRKCGSDYMRFSVGGYCQDCQQKVEFIVREHPRLARDARNQKQEVVV